MNQPNYNRILDLTLEVLFIETPYSHIEYNDLFSRNAVLRNLSNRDKLAVIQKLVKDGYASRFETTDKDIFRYYITVEGILFFDNGKGGYIKNKKLKKEDWIIKKSTFLLLLATSITSVVYTSIKVNEVFHKIPTNQIPTNTVHIKPAKEPLQLQPTKPKEFLKPKT